MNDPAQLLRSVLAEPTADEPRLVWADWLMEQGDPRGEFIRLQIANARYRRERGTATDYYDRRRPEDVLLRAHRLDWFAELEPLVSRQTFHRGFVEEVTLPAADFLRRADELFARAPIRSLTLVDAGSAVAAIAASAHLQKLVSLELLVSHPHGDPLGDDGLAALARSPHLGGLKALAVAGNHIGEPGVHARCASTTLPALVYVNLSANPFPDPVEGYGTDWMTGAVILEGCYLPPEGNALEAKFGRREWLHGPSRLPSYPPSYEDL